MRENSLTGKIDTVLDFVGKNQTFQDAQAIGKFLISLSVECVAHRLS